MPQKPIAEIFVLAGPTHYTNLPIQGPTSFAPGHRYKVFASEDLDAILAVVPESQRKVRLFPRIEDATAEPAAESKAMPESAKERRRR
jgi:hypothetical protein